MQRSHDDVFEDCVSDDSDASDNGDGIDDNDSTCDFSDDVIASVLDLMTDRNDALRLSTIIKSESPTKCLGTPVTAAPSSTTSPPITLRAQGETTCSYDKQSLSRQSLQPQAPAFDPIVLDTHGLSPPRHDVPAVTSEVSTPHKSNEPEWIRALLEGDNDVPVAPLCPSPLSPPSPAANAASTTDTCNNPAITKSEEDQPEWMRALFDVMDTTRPPSPTAVPHSSACSTSSSLEQQSANPLTAPTTSRTAVDVAPSNPLQLAVVAGFASRSSCTSSFSDAALVPLQIDAPTCSLSTSSHVSSLSSSLTWGRFSPAMMPTRMASELKPQASIHASAATPSAAKRLCYVPLARMASHKCRMRLQIATAAADAECTFQPKINTRFAARLRSRRGSLTLVFAHRMASDIAQRQDRRLTRLATLQQQTNDAEREQLLPRHASLVAAGSRRILERSGRWHEPLATRLERLGAQSHKPRQQQREVRAQRRTERRQRKRRERAAAVAATACESLYQRGIAQQQRDAKRQHDSAAALRAASARPQTTAQSQRVLAGRVRAELRRICGDATTHVSFVAFACALLHFGLVPDAATPWRGDARITLLWHTWRCFADRVDDRVAGSSTESTMMLATLERLLRCVMLREATTDPTKRLLINELRVHYLARTRPSSKQASGDASRSPLQNTPKQQQTFKSTRKYTLHGKLVRGDDASAATDVLTQRQHAADARVQALRQLQQQQELAECTFQPRITATRGRSLQRLQQQQRSSTAFTTTLTNTTTDAAASTFERLYRDALARQTNVLDRYLHAQLERDEHAKQLAAIAPSYVDGQSADERLERLERARASNALPAAFDRRIQAMRAAADAQTQRRLEQRAKLEPVRFRKSLDGSTVVKPFYLATDARAEHGRLHYRYRPTTIDDSRERLERVRAVVRRNLRVSGSSAQGLYTNGNTMKGDCEEYEEYEEYDDDAASLCLDVHVAPTRVKRLWFATYDDPDAVATAFATRARLSAAQTAQLCRAVATTQQTARTAVASPLKELGELER